MNFILRLVLFAILIGLHSCSPKLSTYSSEVNFVHKERTGIIALKSIGYGKTFANAVTDAQKNAFKVLLFRGIPGTDLSTPLIANEQEANLKNKAYFNTFFEQGKYKTFMMSSTESSTLTNVKGGKRIYVDVKINYQSLRKDLEQNQIIRKFGF